jgi:hypothetical protein
MSSSAKVLKARLNGSRGFAGLLARWFHWNVPRSNDRHDVLATPTQAQPEPARAPVPLPARPQRRLRRHGSLPATTGPVDLLCGRKVLVICDVDNLSVGAKEAGYTVSYAKLGRLLRENSQNCELHAFFPVDPKRTGRIDYFRKRGWTTHTNAVQTLHTCRGRERLSNSDNQILLWSGLLAASSDADMIVVASGDGTLVCDIARFFARSVTNRPVVTLSLVGSTSARLDASQNADIFANLELGKDVLQWQGKVGHPATAAARPQRVPAHQVPAAKQPHPAAAASGIRQLSVAAATPAV